MDQLNSKSMDQLKTSLTVHTVYSNFSEDDFMEFKLNKNVTLRCLREKIAEEEEINIEDEDILRRSMRLSHRDCDDDDGIIEGYRRS